MSLYRVKINATQLDVQKIFKKPWNGKQNSGI